jgi:hypothetical protein
MTTVPQLLEWMRDGINRSTSRSVATDIFADERKWRIEFIPSFHVRLPQINMIGGKRPTFIRPPIDYSSAQDATDALCEALDAMGIDYDVTPEFNDDESFKSYIVSLKKKAKRISTTQLKRFVIKT